MQYRTHFAHQELKMRNENQRLSTKSEQQQAELVSAKLTIYQHTREMSTKDSTAEQDQKSSRSR